MVGLTKPYYFDEEDYKFLPLFIDDMEDKWTANECVHFIGHKNYLDLINSI